MDFSCGTGLMGHLYVYIIIIIIIIALPYQNAKLNHTPLYTILSQFHPLPSSQPISIRTVLMLFSYFLLDLPSGLY
jgi:hypothetical protein